MSKKHSRYINKLNKISWEQFPLLGLQTREEFYELISNFHPLEYDPCLQLDSERLENLYKGLTIENVGDFPVCTDANYFDSENIQGTKRRYCKFGLKQKNKKRTIEAPPDDLKVIQGWFHDMYRLLELPDYVCTFKSPIITAIDHRNNNRRMFLKIDVKSFFPSISRGKAYRHCINDLRCSQDIASLFASIWTYRGHLVFGSPCSPYLSFWVNKAMWDRINALCITHGGLLRLYVDDLTKLRVLILNCLSHGTLDIKIWIMWFRLLVYHQKLIHRLSGINEYIKYVDKANRRINYDSQNPVTITNTA